MSRPIPKFKQGDMFKILDASPYIYYFIVKEVVERKDGIKYKVNGGWEDQLSYYATHLWIPVEEQAEIEKGIERIVEISMGLRERGT